MPHITVTTSASLSPQQKSDLMSGLGQLIPVIPGKTESVLMVAVSDGVAMCFRGKECPCAYVEVNCYGPTALEARKDFTSQASELLAQVMDIPVGNLYLTFTDRENWGSGGVLI